MLLVALLSAAVLAWRLSQGPIGLDRIAPYVADALSGLEPELSFQIERGELHWEGFRGRPEITMRNIRILNPNGNVIAALPNMNVRLSVSGLLRGVVAPERVILSTPIIRFIHRADGSLGFGVEGLPPPRAVNARDLNDGGLPPPVPVGALDAPAAPTPPPSGDVVARSLISALTRPPTGDSQSEYLDQVAVESSTIVLVDEVTGRRWVAREATFNLARRNGDIELTASLPVVEEGKRWIMSAKGLYTGATGRMKMDVNVEGLRPARVAGLAPQLAPLSMIDLRVTGTMMAMLSFSEDSARIDNVRFDAKGQDGFLRLPEPVAKDYAVKSLQIKGGAGTDINEVTLELFRMELSRRGEVPTVIEMSAQAGALNAAPFIELEARMSELSMAALQEYWPPTAKANTISWIRENLALGGMSNTRLKMQLTGPSINDLDATSLTLTSKLHGITVNYMDKMPKVQSTDGNMTLTLEDLTVDVSNGIVPDPITRKGLRVPSGKLRMFNLGSDYERAHFRFRVVGEFGEAMRLIDQEPLGYATAMGVDAAKATGAADIDMTIEFPLVADLKLDQIAIKVQATTTGAAIPDVALGLPLSGGDMNVVLDNEGMDVSGRGEVGGIPAKVVWRENFGGGLFRSRYVIDPIIDNAHRPLVGLTARIFAPPYIDGATGGHMTYTVMRDGTSTIEGTAELIAPAVAIPELGWRKEPGVVATATVAAKFKNDLLVAIPSFHLTSSDDLDISGAITFDADQAIDTMVINPSTVGETRLSGTVNRDAAGVYVVDIGGPAFNSTYFWKELNRDSERGQAAGEEQTPMRLTAKVDRMWLTPETDFKDVSLLFERDKTAIRAVDFDSKIDGVTPFTFKLASVDGQRKFTGTSTDGGGVVRAIGLFDDIVGGQLEILGEVAPDGTVKGGAEIKKFQLKEAPLVARLLSVAALTGILDELRGNGISFDTLRVPFSYANSILTIKDGEMYGNSLGLTGKGTYDLSHSMMNFEGTLIPAYAVNSALNSIPLLGDILSGGEKGGGILAATYTYRGEAATAEPSVNPLAALTPGFLRHIFDIFRSKGPPVPAEKSPNLAGAG